MRTSSIPNLSKGQVFKYCLATLKELDYEIVDRDMHKGYLLGQKRLSPISFARQLFIELFPGNNGRVRVNAQMQSIAIQLMNWDKNKEKEIEFLTALNQFLKSEPNHYTS